MARLADYGIAFVVLPRPASVSAVAELDAQPGPTRASSNAARMTAWQVGFPTGLVKVADPGAKEPAESAQPLPVVDGSVDTSVDPAADSRVVLVAAADADSFQVRLDGRPLSKQVTDVGAAFDLGPDGGVLEMDTPSDRRWWLLLQGVVLLVLVMLAAPGHRRRGEEAGR